MSKANPSRIVATPARRLALAYAAGFQSVRQSNEVYLWLERHGLVRWTGKRGTDGRTISNGDGDWVITEAGQAVRDRWLDGLPAYLEPARPATVVAVINPPVNGADPGPRQLELPLQSGCPRRLVLLQISPECWVNPAMVRTVAPDADDGVICVWTGDRECWTATASLDEVVRFLLENQDNPGAVAPWVNGGK